MFFSFLTRLMSSPIPEPAPQSIEENRTLKIYVAKEEGKLFQAFNLFYLQSITLLDILVFLPKYGIFFGEKRTWTFSELEKATVERSTRQAKRPPTTHFESTESKIRSKLDDVLPFNTIPIYRFISMPNLSAAEFDKLDSSFHELLPKERIIFSDDTIETIEQKIQAMSELLEEPLCEIQTIGALQTHAYILPSIQKPLGAILSIEQTLFLTTPLAQSTVLCGEYGSGKSTLLVRKAMRTLLLEPEEKILVFAPTLLASELLRNEFVSLMYYGALSIDLNRIVFAPISEEFDTLKAFHEATTIYCDDLYRIASPLIEKLKRHLDHRPLLAASISEDPDIDHTITLTHCYRHAATPNRMHVQEIALLPTLLSELRKILTEQGQGILLVVDEEDEIPSYKEPVDEYFKINSRQLTHNFTLQTQDLEALLITTPHYLHGITSNHLILLSSNDSYDYRDVLSRPSETATIISYSKH